MLRANNHLVIGIRSYCSPPTTPVEIPAPFNAGRTPATNASEFFGQVNCMSSCSRKQRCRHLDSCPPLGTSAIAAQTSHASSCCLERSEPELCLKQRSQHVPR